MRTTSDEVLDTAKKKLEEVYKITNLKKPNKVLVIFIIVDDSIRNITIYQKQLIEKALADFGFEMEDAKPKYMLLLANINLSDLQPKLIPIKMPIS